MQSGLGKIVKGLATGLAVIYTIGVVDSYEHSLSKYNSQKDVLNEQKIELTREKDLARFWINWNGPKSVTTFNKRVESEAIEKLAELEPKYDSLKTVFHKDLGNAYKSWFTYHL